MSTTEWVQEAGMDSDTSSVSVASYAQTAQDAAESATASESAASASALIAAQRADDVAAALGYRDVASATALLADTVLTYSPGVNQVLAGEIIRTRTEGFVYEVAASAAIDQHFTTAGGVKLYRLGNNILFQRDNFDYHVVMGALRNVGGVWSFIDDSGHVPLGVDSVSVDGDEIVINYTSLGATKVVSFVVAPDERYARSGIIAGPSVGTDETRIRIGAPLNYLVDLNTGTVSTSPWWVGHVSTTFAVDYCEILHPSVDQAIYLTAGKAGSASIPQVTLGQTRQSTTRTRVYPRTDIYGYMSYDGAAWSEAFIPAEFQTAITTSFSGGELILSHPSDGGDYGMAISGRGSYVAQLDSFGSTSFNVQFWNLSTGSQVTVEDTSMRFFFNRQNIKCINSGIVNIDPGDWAFSAPMAWLPDPSLLTDTAIPFSNFWVLAVFEKDAAA